MPLPDSNVLRGAYCCLQRIYDIVDGKMMDEFQKEVQLMTSLKHANVLQLLGVSVHASELIMVTELAARGDLMNVLADAKVKIDWDVRQRMLLGIARGMAYLHSRGIVHRDLKSPNVRDHPTHGSSEPSAVVLLTHWNPAADTCARRPERAGCGLWAVALPRRRTRERQDDESRGHRTLECAGDH